MKQNTNKKYYLNAFENISNQIENSEIEDYEIDKIKKFNKKIGFFQRFLIAIRGTVDIDPGRLIGLTDGIFGMLMTLLIFGISLPEAQISNYTNFITYIEGLIPTLGITVVSFVLIGSIWIYHHEFIKIKTVNIIYLWINILFLICLSFIPFTTSIIGTYSNYFLSEQIFGLNIFLTLMSFLLMYYYAYNRKFLENNPTKKERNYTRNTMIILMLLTMIINILTLRMSPNFIYLFLLVPVITTFRDITFKMSNQKK